VQKGVQHLVLGLAVPGSHFSALSSIPFPQTGRFGVTLAEGIGGGSGIVAVGVVNGLVTEGVLD